MARETQEYPRNNQLQNSAAPGITEDYIAQVSEEIEGRVPKKLSQEFSRTESRIWVHCPSWTNFHKYRHSPEPLREHSGTLT